MFAVSPRCKLGSDQHRSLSMECCVLVITFRLRFRNCEPLLERSTWIGVVVVGAPAVALALSDAVVLRSGPVRVVPVRCAL